MLFNLRNVVTASLAVTQVAAKEYTLNTYWGQSGVGDSLRTYCDSTSIDYVTLAFVNNSPENGNGTNYPGTNFAAHCAADVYEVDGRKSKLLSSCTYMMEDIKYCQKAGKKVLLSIGGEFSSYSNYTVTDARRGREFAEFLYYAFGPYNASWDGPRPFDVSPTNHTALDGFDFDIEKKFDNQQPWVFMVQRLRELIAAGPRKKMVVTAAPQCPTSDQYIQMKKILKNAQFDKIFIQFYNNPSCDATTDNFNFNEWVNFFKGTPSANAELYVGLPGSVKAAGNGYLPPKKAQEFICKMKQNPNFAGIMLWDANFAHINKKDGEYFYDSIGEALDCGFCGPAIDKCTAKREALPFVA